MLMRHRRAVPPEALALELHQEIELLEGRLHAMGGDGDCAYERAMSSLYQTMLDERRRRLELLQAETA